MHESKGHNIPISASRRIIMDLMHEARQVPSIPVQRVIELKDLVSIRRNTQPRISWFVIFMKAFSLVAKDYPQLRRSLISCPWIRFYDHPYSNCSLAIEREHMGERCLFFSQFRGPESQSLVDLQKALDRYKSAPVESMGMYRRVLHIGTLPRFIRKFLWWSSLNVSGSKRAKRMGTFGVTSYGSLGAESLHPISPLSFTLNFGPISKEGTVALKIIYDHRILDGSEVARRLKDIEEALHGAIRAELKLLTQIPDFATDTDTESLDKQSQIRQDEAHEKPEPKLELDPTPARVNRTPANS